ncbi:MAG: 50S ribosomal protein L10 [Deltaproteobacteria bacterium]|nr:50S ribosomal protein L10 [Deltaproteobacteria bacterium]MBK8241384.1 50S ribosomal protein L10 [Deltaproteobacteria bacterium]MBK8717099.1 50S ribosomal protein L10 [Deltaproteobacteria bacterium]MBP7286377.1 50S ribosomal protein L10 [Nannocystaceae bacterium]
MDTTQKQELSSKLREELSQASAFVLVEFAGLTVASVNELRGKFREAGCSYHVYKNSTIRFAIQETDHAAATPLLKGVSGLAFHPDDPGAAARVARDFAKDNDKFKLKGGVAYGKMLDADGVVALANMPGPRELKAQFLALLNTPATQFVRVLQASAQGLLNVLNARKEKLEAA